MSIWTRAEKKLSYYRQNFRSLLVLRISSRFSFLLKSKDELPSHFCVVPWAHVMINSEKKVSPCSRINKGYLYGDFDKGELSESWSSERAEALRKLMLSGSRPHVCFFCNSQDRANMKAYRHVERDRLQFRGRTIRDLNQQFGLKNTRPISIEFRFSNVCNLRCRTCNSQYSTSWYHEAVEFYGEEKETRPKKTFSTTEDLQRFFEKELPHLQHIKILGGEPLIQDEFYLLLEKLISLNKTDVQITVTTNLTRLKHKNWSFLEFYQRFPNLRLGVSLDGIGEKAELIRKGTSWPEMEKNLKLIRVLGRLHQIEPYPVISVLNCFHITNLLTYLVETQLLRANQSPTRNYVQHPQYLSVHILNRQERLTLERHYREYLAEARLNFGPAITKVLESYLNDILAFLNTDELLHLRPEFCEKMKWLDHSRQESTLQMFPELKSLWLESERSAATAQPEL